jgi:uncharacterized membrane protein YfcA
LAHARKLSITMLALLAVAAFFAGVIDSIVGGGGLITVPVFLIILGPNASAIGSNKVAAVFSQVAAAYVYWREYGKQQHVDASISKAQLIARAFISTSVGAAIGALTAPQLPTWFFRWFIIVIAPLILTLVLSRGLWRTDRVRTSRPGLATAATFFAGLYDGIAGPGGGTLMFLSLFAVGGVPAGYAISTGKFANLGSALTSLIFYQAQGQVRWDLGLTAGIPIAFGAYLGAHASTQWIKKDQTKDRASQIARAALVVVTVLLMVRILLS